MKQISSAPELKDEIWLHVRSLGNWTNKLNEYFSKFSNFKRKNSIIHPSSVRSVIKSITPVEKTTTNSADVKRRTSRKNVNFACDIKLNVSNRIENVLIEVNILIYFRNIVEWKNY